MNQRPAELRHLAADLEDERRLSSWHADRLN